MHVSPSQVVAVRVRGRRAGDIAARVVVRVARPLSFWPSLLVVIR
ncbi:hypothetical protein [Enterobacter hormaechei]|nr:hypothetical protein [Enterobacter hormaechei]